ncbi:phospholipid phosphatase-related protein type 2-like [Melopsittacus undulatus]|uniref:phospholipid phosphatase-related protein type 2-like n=1 Tax=Melopsittacus undulatus TaxID=13146 RepID=UPI00146E2652|nr:phospholipid phosphatase-related protein type 2-like [Melopsittacus undulatus]
MAAVSGYFFLEVLILGSVASLWYLLEFSEPFPVPQGGFFCRDPAFGRPYPGPPRGQPRPPRAGLWAGDGRARAHHGAGGAPGAPRALPGGALPPPPCGAGAAEPP